MNNAVTHFEYQGNRIAFSSDNEGTMINATQMAKPFGKRPVEFLRNDQAQGFLTELSEVRNCTSADLVKVSKGGVSQGTWMHEDVAMEFARWLSPSFAIWCNDRIKELLKHGITATISPEQLMNDPDFLIQTLTALKKERAEKERITERASLLEGTIAKQAPKVQYVNEVLQSESTYNTNLIAKELGMSAVTLNRVLRDNHVQYYQGGTWILYSKFQNKGYTKTKTHTYTGTDGTQRTSMQTVWTEKGRKFIHEVIEAKEAKTKSA